MARSSKPEPTESGAAGEPQRGAGRVASRSGATRLGAKTRAGPHTRARAKPVPDEVHGPEKATTTEALPEVTTEALPEAARAAAELRLPEVMRMPDVEPLSPVPLMAAPAEALADENVPEPAPAPIVEPVEAEPPEAGGIEAALIAITVADARTAGATIPNVMHEVERLSGMALVYWQDHLERTIATGQAIMACGSPRAAAQLQATYLQSSLTSAIAHAGALARLSTEIARDMSPLRSR